MSVLPHAWTVSLNDVLHTGTSEAARMFGPRTWWGGPLDVEKLALSSTRVAATALQQLTGRKFDFSAHRVAASFASLNTIRINGSQTQGFAPISGFWRTKDGWIRLHGNYPHHAQAIYDGLGLSTHDSLQAVLATSKAIDNETFIMDAGGVAAAVRTRQEWNNTPMGLNASSGPWLKFVSNPIDQAGTTWRKPRDRSDAPLRGLRVLDFSRVVAGPSASRLLGALGADVLRVDPPRYPELLNQYIDTGFSKRSIVLDFNDSSDYATLRELLCGSHAVILGYRPGALEKFGLTPQAITAEWPEVKVVRFNAWGWNGPWKHRRGFDSIVQAACGIAEVYRKPDGTLGNLPVQALDHATGMGIVAAIAVLLSQSQYSWAQTSLIRTAHELLNFPATELPKATLESPVRKISATYYGTLEHAPPPVLLDGKGVEYAQPPVAYGSSEPSWLPS